MQSTRYYNDNAQHLTRQYNALKASAVHRNWSGKHLPKSPGLACDIGAGSGRDASWLASKGWDVIAVEPAQAMREQASTNTHANVTWLDDSLPDLNRLRQLGHRFDLILLSAVWMHVAPAQRQRVFRILSEMLKPSGVLVISLRHGGDDAENRARGFHAVSAEELMGFARQRALAVTDRLSERDPNRPHIDWETVVFTMPDDGTGSLPLLRHIIINDNKSSSYKLGLLRVLTRIAEGSPGAVLRRTDYAKDARRAQQGRMDDYVEIPLGLVGLYWIRQYKPLLLQHNIPQQPNIRQGYGFAGDDFNQLHDVSDHGLKIGAMFAADRAPVIIGAIRDACETIVKMPAHYITYPGQSEQVFECARQGVRKSRKPIVLSPEFLASFGSFRVPAKLWDTLGHYACWLEPTILREWERMTLGWGVAEKSINRRVFDWDEDKRDTGIAHDRAQELKKQGAQVVCVWSAAKPKLLHIDHCFPWARWTNNDLWNLMPAQQDVNLSKGDKLPSALAMADAEQRIKDWWQSAYVDSNLQERFTMEATCSLPRLVDNDTPSLDNLYQAMLHQRARLKTDQQIVEWSFRG